MAEVSTEEDVAREILSIFMMNSDCHPNYELFFSKVNVELIKRGFNTDEIASGLQYAVDHNWIEYMLHSLKITGEGFRQA